MRQVVSRAHQVVQALPLKDNIYVCVRCGKRGPLSDLFGRAREDRCVPHFENASSGWRHEP